MPTFVGKNLLQIRQAWDEFFREHPEYRILHSHVRSYASVYLPIAKKYGLKTIIHSHSTSNGKGVKGMIKAMLQYPLRFVADEYFSCSEEAGRWLFGDKIVAGEHHYILKNAIDAAAYRYDEAVRRDYRQQLGLDGKYVFVHVGRFHPAKNHAFMLRVFQKIQKAESDTALLLLGDGDLRSEIEKQIEELGIQDAVMLLGNRNDVPKILQATDCMLFPSLWEGLGIVAVEAQATGMGCICSNQVPRLVKVTDDCWFLPLEEEIWAENALEQFRRCQEQRQDTYDAIVASGFDIRSTAKWLGEFYLSCY